MQAGETAFVATPVSDEPEEEQEEEAKKTVTIRYSIFFDGTLNNRTNIDQRLVSADESKLTEEERKDAKELEKKMSEEDRKRALEIYKEYGGGDTSYENYYTNVSIMEKHVEDAQEFDYTLTAYIEGAGSDDKMEDDAFGYGLGVANWVKKRDAGVRKKVEKGLEKVLADVTEKVKTDEVIEKLIIDVFGFSRGAAGARNFIHETLNGDELEPAMLQMTNKGYKVKRVNVCFAGLYDTVSSHGLFYFNDVSDLNLRSVRHAEHVLHLAAADEHRKNFSLTTIDSAGFKGREIYLPGVHSDIGGGYRDGAAEKQVIYDGPEHIARRDRDDLINAGWYQEREIEIKTYMVDEYDEYAILTVNRASVSNKYSRIPLHIMARFARDSKINIRSNLERTEEISGDKLTKAKELIDKYIDATKPDNEKNLQSTAEDWVEENQKTLQDLKRDYHELLRDLRHDYFHFSAKWKFGLKPRMSWWTSTRYRKTYSG